MEKLLGLDRIPEVCMLCEKVELLGQDFGPSHPFIYYGATIAQPRSKDTSSLPSLRTSANRMRLFFITSSRSAVLDGEIACIDDSGRSVFNDLLFRRAARAATGREESPAEEIAVP